MCDEVLETDRFPEIVYECSRVSASGSGDRYWVALNGELTLHGVTEVDAGFGASDHQRHFASGDGRFHGAAE